ncbi:MAG: hypothetical protein P8J37_23215 [Fuerstiella sp.]|nr:hypothetical protein [Fuerstiella sp.]
MRKVSILPSAWNVPAEFRERLGDQVGRQRAMLSDGHLLLILHDLPSPEDIERKGRFFWRQPDGTWSSYSRDSGPRGVSKHLDEYFNLVTRFEEQDEQATSSADYFSVIYGLAPIHRSARNMHQALQQARELCPQDRDIINFRDRAYRIERTAELLMGDAKASLEFSIARRTEEQAESSHQMAVSSHRLNILAAFFFPMATLSALYGVNLQHGLEKIQSISELASAPPPSFPFLLIILVGIVLGFVLKSFVASGKPSRPENVEKV